MGKKFNKLITEAIKSGEIIPYFPFTPTRDSKVMVQVDKRYEMTFNYSILARLLPEFIEHITLERLRSTDNFKNATLNDKLILIHSQKSKEEITRELIKTIYSSGNNTIKKHFSPKIIEISATAKEQFDDFMNKYKKMKTIIFNLNNNHKFPKKSPLDIERRLRMESKRIFRTSKYNSGLFNEYCKALPSYRNIYVATGLDIYRQEYFMNKIYKSDSQYILALNKLGSKPRSIGFKKTLRGLRLYSEYYKHIFEFKSRKKNKVKDPKLTAAQRLRTNNGSIHVDNDDAIDEVIKVYTAFFRFVEKSDLEPFDTKKYLDYLNNWFTAIENKNN